MAYTPTREELENPKLKGIVIYEWWYEGNDSIDPAKCFPYIEYRICYDSWFVVTCNNKIAIYPQSKSDIETLIRLFTNPNE